MATVRQNYIVQSVSWLVIGLSKRTPASRKFWPDRASVEAGHPFGLSACVPHADATVCLNYCAAIPPPGKRLYSAPTSTLNRIVVGGQPARQSAVCTPNNASAAMTVSGQCRLRVSTFRLSAATVAMSLTGSRFSSESAPRPFHHGIRGRGGTIYTAALPSNERQVQADMRTHLIHRPARDIIPPLGGARVSFY